MQRPLREPQSEQDDGAAAGIVAAAQGGEDNAALDWKVQAKLVVVLADERSHMASVGE